MTAPAQNIVIIGGGIFGTSTAAHLARRGARVTLITEGPLASGASGRSLAWLNSAGSRSLPYHQLRLAGIDRWRTFETEHPGLENVIHFSGGLTWAPEGDSFEDRHLHERSLGYDSRWLTPADVAKAVPGVDPGAVAAEGAIFNPGEGWVDLPSVIDKLVREVRTFGGQIRDSGGRAKTIVENGRAVGVELSDGTRIEADAVVLATGPDVPDQLAELGVAIPNASPAAFVVFTKPVDTPLRAVLNTPRVAVRRTLEGGLALDSGWSEEAIVLNNDGSLTIGDELVNGLLHEAQRVLAGNPALEMDHIGAGYKPIPGDGEPVIGGIDAIPGLYVGFSHSGATLGLLIGELLAEEIIDQRRSPLLETFQAARFAQAD